jgi:hypothetical protein
MGRTIPSWRIIVEQEIAAMSRFKQFHCIAIQLARGGVLLHAHNI